MLAAARNGDTAAAEIWYTRAQGAEVLPMIPVQKDTLVQRSSILAQKQIIGDWDSNLFDAQIARSRDASERGAGCKPDELTYQALINAASKLLGCEKGSKGHLAVQHFMLESLSGRMILLPSHSGSGSCAWRCAEEGRPGGG